MICVRSPAADSLWDVGTTSKYTQAHLGAGIETYSSGAATFTSFTYANCAGGEIFNQGGFVLTFK